ncbi:Ras- protein Rab-35 [Paramecium bursaria]
MSKSKPFTCLFKYLEMHLMKHNLFNKNDILESQESRENIHHQSILHQVMDEKCIFYLNQDIICVSKTKMFDGVNFKIQFWEENSVSERRLEKYNPYRLVDAVIIIIDLKNKNSIKQIYEYYWKQDQLQLQQINVIHIKDIKDKIFYQIFRVITKSQLRGISNQLGLQFFEVTAKDNSLIDTMFETIFLQCVGFFMKQGNIKQSNLCLYYQDQNKGLQKCIYEYKMKSKIYIAISVLFVCLSILCFSCINNIISPSIEGTIYGLIIFSLILTITILNMRNII